MPLNDETALLAKALQCDPAALEQIYDRYSNALFAYAFRLLGDSTLAEDCVAETFSRFLGALRKQQGPHSHLSAYLYRIAHNWITDQYRKSPPEPAVSIEDMDIPHSAEIELNVENSILSGKIRKAMRLLTPDQRLAISMRYIEGWDNEEVAAAMHKDTGAVKAQLHRGLEALRRILKERGSP